MTDFADFKAQIAEYANRQDWSDALVTGFVRQSEQKFNADLRVDRMLATIKNLVSCSCAELPDDWLETDFMLIQSGATPTGWLPIRYKPRDEFYRLPLTPYGNPSYTQNPNSTVNSYTIEGRTIYFGGPPDAINGVLFQMTYYQEVPVFADDTPSWVYTKYPKLYLFAALSNADFHAVGEEQTAMLLGQQVDQMISRLNDNHRLSKASGSRLQRTKMRSFG